MFILGPVKDRNLSQVYDCIFLLEKENKNGWGLGLPDKLNVR